MFYPSSLSNLQGSFLKFQKIHFVFWFILIIPFSAFTQAVLDEHSHHTDFLHLHSSSLKFGHLDPALTSVKQPPPPKGYNIENSSYLKDMESSKNFKQPPVSIMENLVCLNSEKSCFHRDHEIESHRNDISPNNNLSKSVVQKEPGSSFSKDTSLNKKNITLSGTSNSAEQQAVCDIQGFIEKRGHALAEHIRSMDIFSCLVNLFTKYDKSIRTQIFRMENMLSIANITEEQARSYNGTDPNEVLQKYYLFLRTGYYNYFYHNEEMDWADPDNKSQVDTAMVSALTAFIENPRFYDINEEHGQVLFEVLTGTDSAEQQAHFLPKYKEYLKQFNEEYIGKHSMAGAVNSIFVALFRGHQQSEFQTMVAEDTELIDILKDFALSGWKIGTSVEFLAANSALELSRFLQYDKAEIYSDVTSAIREIFNKYKFVGEGSGISVSALRNVLHFGKCEEFDVCEVAEELEEQILSKKYECTQVPVVIRAQELDPEQLMDTCEMLAEQEDYFHDKLMTHREDPVRHDNNTKLEVVILSDHSSYNTYSGLFFGNSTNNGGIYLEGDPSRPGNKARFIAYTADWLADRPIWNLKHEYVHYLDGRFNLYGSFSDLKVSTHKTVWWLEGLAEYISLKDDNRVANQLLDDSQHPALSDIFKNTYSDSLDLVYRWSYFAVRFMFEEHLGEVSRFLDYFREGQYDEYLDYLDESVGSKYDTEFSDWLTVLKEREIRISPFPILRFADVQNPNPLNLLDYFQNSQELTFVVESSNPEVVKVELVEGSKLRLTPISPGFSEITIRASSPDNSVSITIPITIREGIRVFEIVLDEPISTFEGTRTIDLSKYVEGPSKEDIVFTVESENPEIARVNVEGSMLTIRAVGKGWARMTLSAEYEGMMPGQPFRVRIVDGEEIASGYCWSKPSDKEYGYITEMSLAGRRMGDHQNKVYSFINDNDRIHMYAGSSYDLDVVSGTTTAVNDDMYRVEVWVDWNDDKDFSDENEKIMNQDVVLSDINVFPKVSSVLEVPEDVAGDRRLRIRISNKEENSPDVCSNYNKGEVEDYLLYIYTSGPPRINVHNIPGEKESLLKIRTSYKEIPLSEVFSSDNRRDMLVYEVSPVNSEIARVWIEDDILKIRKASSEERTEPIDITLTARTPDLRIREPKDISIVFEPYTLPLFLSADNERRESFVRIVNKSDSAGTVRITGRDEERVQGFVDLSLGANSTAHFNSTDLANGNENKGLVGSLGSGEGDWRLTLTSDNLDFHAAVYVRVKGDGFVTSINGEVDSEMTEETYTYFVPIFNPASNQRQRSLLRLFNPHTSSAEINIMGIDDRGNERDVVKLMLSPESLRKITSKDLESGAEGLEGQFGDGYGKWRLKISSSHSLDVMNLLESPNGLLSNLSQTFLFSSRGDLHKNLIKTFLPVGENRHGFVRIINHSREPGKITIRVTDDLSRAYKPTREARKITFPIGALEAKHFNSNDLQKGNEDKGLPARGLGPPQGMWRLEFEESDLNIQVLSYMRAEDGFLTSLDNILPVYGNNQYSVLFFNPASNRDQRNLLRFINTDQNKTAFVSIRGVDDSGRVSDEVVFNVSPSRVKTLSALDLETGAEGLRGSLGDGQGKWQLFITSGHSLLIMNLLESPNGYISNLSVP